MCVGMYVYMNGCTVAVGLTDYTETLLDLDVRHDPIKR